MTDREVQKLNRKDLLRFLLEAQTENESLRRDRTELRKQVKALEEALDLAKEQHTPQEAPTPLVLQEARLAADEAVFAEREALVQREQKLLEWEQRLKEIDRGNLAPEDFLADIADMLRELVQSYQAVPNAHTLFPPEGEVIGPCPRCGKRVTERKQGFFCEDRHCGFALWKDSKFFSDKRKKLTGDLVAALLKDGQVPLKGCWSKRTGKTYDAILSLEDNNAGESPRFRLEFEGSPAK